MSPNREPWERIVTSATTEVGAIESGDESSGPDSLLTIRHALFIVALAVGWVWALSGVREADLGNFGIVTILPIVAFVLIGAALLGFVASLMGNAESRIQGAYVFGITVMLHGMPTFVYDNLRFSWAWKHVGIVEYIQRVGDVDPAIESLGVYHNWPGFFGLNAWITDISRLDSALSYAQWAPIAFNVLFIGALYVMFSAFTNDSRKVWTALLIFTLGNWVGQDYFAPQAMAFFLYLVAMAILLRWYSNEDQSPDGLLAVTEDRIPPNSLASFAMSLVLTVVLLAIAAIHQLTPIVTIAAIGALVTFRIVRVSWPLFAMLAFTIAWLAGPAREFMIENLTSVARELGGFQANLDDTLVSYEIVNTAQRVISQVARILSASVFLLAGLGWLRRRKRKLRSGWVLLLAAVPGFLVLVSSYGGEIIFRAFLFGLPFAAFLAASLWYPDPKAGHSRWTAVTLTIALFSLTAGLLIADFGTDNRQVFDSDEVAAADYLFAVAEPGALIIEGSRDYPRQYRNYEKFTFLALDRSTPDTLEGLLADPATKLESWVSDDDRYNGGYVIITRSQRASVTELGTLLSPTLDTIENALLASPRWEVVFESGEARVFAPVDQA